MTAWFKSTARDHFAARRSASAAFGGAIALTDETVDSWCRSYAMLALECADCEAPLLEFDPREIGGEDGGIVP